MPKILKLLLVLSILGLASTAKATVYNATNADSDMWHGGNHNHSLWLPGLLAGNDWLINPNNPPGTFDYNEGTGEVSFSGTVTNEVDSTSSGDFQFFFVRSTGNPKLELKSEAYDPAPAGGGVNPGDWIFFDFDPNKQSTLTGTSGAIDNLNFVFTQKDTGTTGYKGQFGIGANGKNINLGYSAWLDWALDPGAILTSSVTACPDSIRNCSGYGDINIDLAAVPVPAAFWLFGTALIGFIGFSRRRSI